jgi:hypothetical protein
MRGPFVARHGTGCIVPALGGPFELPGGKGDPWVPRRERLGRAGLSWRGGPLPRAERGVPWLPRARLLVRRRAGGRRCASLCCPRGGRWRAGEMRAEREVVTVCLGGNSALTPGAVGGSGGVGLVWGGWPHGGWDGGGGGRRGSFRCHPPGSAGQTQAHGGFTMGATIHSLGVLPFVSSSCGEISVMLGTWGAVGEGGRQACSGVEVLFFINQREKVAH